MLRCSPKKHEYETPRQTKEGNDSILKTSFEDGYKDAQHLTNFLNKSHYSTWRTEKKSFPHKISSKNLTREGDFFFHNLKEDKNTSKIGFTPVFVLVTKSPIIFGKESIIEKVEESNKIIKESFRSTDPITMRYDEKRKPRHFERFKRLIECRHPHGITGVDHNESEKSVFYKTFRNDNVVREEPNSHQSFLFDREWKIKKRSQPPIDKWKFRETLQLRKFTNENLRGYNILTNRLLQ